MNTIDSFTDEQLLNLINNTINDKTEFKIDELTGGSVQITGTHNRTVTKYRVSLYFGYKGKHPITRTFDIDFDLVFIWVKSIFTKIKTLEVKNSGMKFNELNLLMNKPCTVVSNKVVSISISKGTVPPPVHQNFILKINDKVYECVSYQFLENDKVKVGYRGATDITYLTTSLNVFNNSKEL